VEPEAEPKGDAEVVTVPEKVPEEKFSYSARPTALDMILMTKDSERDTELKKEPEVIAIDPEMVTDHKLDDMPSEPKLDDSLKTELGVSDLVIEEEKLEIREKIEFASGDIDEMDDL